MVGQLSEQIDSCIMFSALLRPSLGARCASVVGVNAIRTPLTQCVALSTTADQADETTVDNGRDPVKMYNMISGIEEVLKNPIYTPSRYSYPLVSVKSDLHCGHCFIVLTFFFLELCTCSCAIWTSSS